MPTVDAWGISAAGKPVAPMSVERREPAAHDVVVEILFCGVCHSDIHQARDEWSGARFPMVPGHEIVGKVARVGAAVTKLAVGELAGVGCYVDSCRACVACKAGFEQFCEKGAAFTYSSTEMDRKTPTYGGYSTHIVVDERYVLRIPEGLDPASAAPLLCAGITTYSPLREWGCKPEDRVGVVGLGGLGHLAVKLAASLDAKVTVLSGSAAKEADARRLGADDFVVTKDRGVFDRLAGTMDLIIDTVSEAHDYDAYLRLLRMRGTMVLVGLPAGSAALRPGALVRRNKRLVGSMMGGIAETQEMLDHCAAHGIVADVEVIPPEKLNEAYARVLASDVRYRFVVDVARSR